MAQPLRAVRLSDGSLTAEPDEVDQQATAVWGRIYNGIGRTHSEAVAAYMQHNSGLVFERSACYQLPALTVRDLRTACRGAKATAAGPDCWAPAEWRLLSDEAIRRLVQLLTCIEQGGEWPAALSHATSAYLSKDPNKATDPLAYRVLSLLPVLYRRWPAVRLRHLAAWIDEWRLPEMFAGVPGVGAADATW